VTDDVPLSPAQRTKVRRLSRPEEPGPGEQAGELALVPYLDILMNVMMFVLAGVAITFVSSVAVSAPSVGLGTRPPANQNALDLSVLVTDAGIGVKTSAGNVAAGCAEAGAGLAVPKRSGAHDLAALTACVKRLKQARAEFDGETQVTILASPGVEMQTILDVMDALRQDGGADLFPDVRFGVVR